MSAIAAATAASRAGLESRPKSKHVWFWHKKRQLDACMRCHFQSGMWLGYVPKHHTCGIEIIKEMVK